MKDLPRWFVSTKFMRSYTLISWFLSTPETLTFNTTYLDSLLFFLTHN